MGKVMEIKESGYRKIVRECRCIDSGSNENDLRNTIQVVLLIAQEELNKEKELSISDETENR